MRKIIWTLFIPFAWPVIKERVLSGGQKKKRSTKRRR